jgi:hypothetical protein
VKAEVTKDDFQWFLGWLADNGYKVTGISMPSAGRYDKITYAIEYEMAEKKEN